MYLCGKKTAAFIAAIIVAFIAIFNLRINERQVN